jgi:hypothetical protein
MDPSKADVPPKTHKQDHPMILFKVGASSDADEDTLATTTSVGPFIVAAAHKRHAVALVSLNYSIAVRRKPGSNTPLQLWSQGNPHCVVTQVNVDEREIQRSLIVLGNDIASQFLDKAILSIEDEEVAHMVWWPCDDNAPCPV